MAFFETKVRPLLVERCLECHGEKKQKGGLRLDSKSGWEKGGETGTAIVPGKAEESLLIKAVSYLDKDLQMPPKKQLAPEEVAVLKEWVRRGAPDPRLATVAVAEAQPDKDEWADAFQKRLDWWSLKPLRETAPPAVADEAWSREPVDRFLRAGLDAAGLAPAARAEPEVLLRRLSQVLTGLPPAPELRARFLEQWQVNPAATYEKLVDELLASPHFGEHFARHWMDVVRYTDTYGYEWDIAAKGAYEYRDYLIRAFNGDVSYRQFVTEQLAGDLLPEPRIDRELGLNESMIGPMFYHLGEHRHGNSTAFNGIHQDMVNNKIDAFSKAFLATTVACSRCHNHKLEAVSQRDYYALAAVFMTPRWIPRVVDAPGKNDTAIAQLKELRGELRGALATQWRAALKDASWSRADLEKATPGTARRRPCRAENRRPRVPDRAPASARRRHRKGLERPRRGMEKHARAAAPGERRLHYAGGFSRGEAAGGLAQRRRRNAARLGRGRRAADRAGGRGRGRALAAARLSHECAFFQAPRRVDPAAERAGRRAHDQRADGRRGIRRLAGDDRECHSG